MKKKARLPAQRDYPKEIFFYDKTYDVKLLKTLADKWGASGVCDSGNKSIRMQRGMSKEEMLSTFIHELIHVIEFELPMKISHKTVHKLEAGLYELIVRNFLK